MSAPDPDLDLPGDIIPVVRGLPRVLEGADRLVSKGRIVKEAATDTRDVPSPIVTTTETDHHVTIINPTTIGTTGRSKAKWKNEEWYS